jgi:hypothetical protein
MVHVQLQIEAARAAVAIVAATASAALLQCLQL